MVEKDSARAAALKRLKAKREFKMHVVTYVIVNAVLIGIWALTGQGSFWPIWVLVFWGVGLALNGWTAYVQKPISEADIQREMDRSR